MDGLTVNGLKFLTTISHDIYYQMLQYINNPIVLVYKKCINKVKTLYNKGGFKTTSIHCDSEFHKAMGVYSAEQKPPIKMNYAAAQEH
eukprot:9014075-Ditylum_brightwellii.AAC.1